MILDFRKPVSALSYSTTTSSKDSSQTCSAWINTALICLKSFNAVEGATPSVPFNGSPLRRVIAKSAKILGEV